MSCGAMHEFALVLDKAGFDADLVQRVVNSRGNKQAKAMYATVATDTKVDGRFELIKTTEIIVPGNYKPRRCLDSFRRRHWWKFRYYYNNDITDEHFRLTKVELWPERKLKVKIFRIKGIVTSLDCLVYLRSQKAILTGAQGAALLWKQQKEALPMNQFSLSFGEKEMLWRDADGSYSIPFLVRRLPGDIFGFCLKKFEEPVSQAYCLLCFSDE